MEEEIKQTYLDPISNFVTQDDMRAFVNSSLTNLNQPMRMQSKSMESAGFVSGISGNGWKIDAQGNCEFNNGYFRGDITGASGTFSGTIAGGSLDIGGDDATSAHIDSSGNQWWGASVANKATAPARVSNEGVANFSKITIDGSSIGGYAYFISDSLDTSAKTILKDFTFSPTDYSGAFKTGDITWNTTTGAITGGSGGLFNKSGLIFASAGVATITLDGTTGSATFAGTLSAPSGTLGTITSGTIYSGLFSTGTSGDTGQRIVMDTADDTLKYYNSANENLMSIGVGGTYTEQIKRTGTTSVASQFSDLDGNDINTVNLTEFQILGTSSTGSSIQSNHYGLGHSAYFLVQSNASRTKATARIDAVSGQGAHLLLTPIANTPASPSEGEIYTDTDHHIYYYNGTSQVQLDNSSNVSVFGDGSDGDETISSNTDLTSDKFYNNLTISNNAILNTAGYRIFVKGTLTVGSGCTIQYTHTAAGNGTPGVSNANGTGGTAGAAPASGSMYGGKAGVAGVNGGIGDSGAGASNGSDGNSPSAITYAIFSCVQHGSAGGNGGNGSVTGRGTGGIAGVDNTTTLTKNIPRNLTGAYLLEELGNMVTSANSSGGGGGGGGGGKDAAGGSRGGGGGGAGGNGSSGGIIAIFAKEIINSGTIKSAGGVGGNGGQGGNGHAEGGGGSGGGGGGAGGNGGAGGVLILVYSSLSGAGTQTAPGGTGGTGGTKGSGDGTGYTEAANGTDGATGDTGKVIEIVV